MKSVAGTQASASRDCKRLHTQLCSRHRRCFGVDKSRSIAPMRPSRRRTEIKAGLPDGNSLAVIQQGTAFAILVVGEGFYTRTQLPEEAPGRPSVLPIFAGVTGLIAAMVLLKLEQGEALGLIVGGVCSGLLLLLNIKRSFDTEADSSEFPGPKAWPLFVSTGAFFAMLAFLESFQYLS